MLGLHEVRTSSKEVYVYGESQLPDKIEYLPTEHKLGVKRFKDLAKHTVCVSSTYASTQKGKFRT